MIKMVLTKTNMMGHLHIYKIYDIKYFVDVLNEVI